MKVLGTNGDNFDKKYICEVSHEELEKFMNLYYGKMAVLRAGEEIDLSKGHDFASDAKIALRKTEEFISSSSEIVKAIAEGVSLFGAKND